MENLGKTLTGHIAEKQLHHDVATPRIAPERAGNRIDSDRGCVGRLFAIEDLDDCWHCLRRGIAREPMNRKARAVTQDSTKGDFLLPRKFIFGNFPAMELEIHVFVEADFTLLHQAQRGECRDRFADRSRLKESLGCDRPLTSNVGKAVCPSPEDLLVIEKGEADAGDLVMLHPVRDGHHLQRLAFNRDSWQQTIFDASNPSFEICLTRSLPDPPGAWLAWVRRWTNAPRVFIHTDGEERKDSGQKDSVSHVRPHWVEGS